jgi:hypothetical protein
MNRFLPIYILRALLPITAVAALSATSASYFVDFAAGSDAAAGTSTATAWKHCPGDANATGTAASTSLSAGDTVNFKGGVAYRGSIALKKGGTAESRITYTTASAWGTGRAILSGAEPLALTWTNCTSADDCFGNPYYTNIWYVSAPEGVTNCWQRLFQAGELLHVAQSTPSAERLQWDRISDEWWQATAQSTTTTVTDTGRLTNAAVTWYEDAWVGVWTTGNRATLRPITNYNTSTHTITFPTTPAVQGDQPADWRYTILNHPADINAAGEYAIRGGRLYLWAQGDADPNSETLSIGTRKRIFYTATSDITDAADYITFENLEMCGTYGDPVADNETSSGNAINIINNPEAATVVTNCYFHDFSAPCYMPEIISVLSSGQTQIRGNWFSNSITRGIIIFHSTNNVISGNVMHNFVGTAIRFYNTYGMEVSDNRLSLLTGCHANGITCYDEGAWINTNTVIARNIVTDAIRPLTFQGARDILIANNVFVSDTVSDGAYVAEWGSAGVSTCTGTIRIHNNTFLGGQLMSVLLSGDGPNVDYDIRNNIFNGMTGGTNRTYNLYTRPEWTPTLGTGEATNTVAALIPGYATNNFLITTNIGLGWARDGGTNLTEFFSTDIRGLTRGAAWDIGAYEFQEGEEVEPEPEEPPAAVSGSATAARVNVETLILR